MKTSIQKFTVSVVISVVTICSLFFILPGYCQDAKKVALCPFQMNASQDLTFLQKGLFSMMSSRLADPGKVEIFDRETIDNALEKAQMSAGTKGPINKEKAKIIGKSIGVDYVLFGNVTMFGDSVSLDTTMVDVTGDSPALTFSRQADQPGAVITELDLIATQINQKVFNRQEEAFIPQVQTVQAPRQQSQYSDQASGTLLGNHRVLFSANGEIIGMAAGDVDGDKENEVVIIYSQMIEILKDNKNGHLVSIEKIKDGAQMDLVGVDVADINNNGVAEIFISRVLRNSGYVKSYVLEKQGEVYKNISGDLPWYLRVVKSKNTKPELFAQNSGRLGPYKGSSFNVRWENNGYVPGQRLRVPDTFTVMSMTTSVGVGDVPSSRLFTDKSGRLTIFDESGKVEWSGEDDYGGSKVYYEFKETDNIIQDISEGKGEFFQPRSLVVSLRNTDERQAVVIRNIDATGGLFAKARRYKSGMIEVLDWNQMGLSSERGPKKIPGQITDIAFDDVDNDGDQDLLVSFIKKSVNYSSGKSKSMIMAYDMK